MQYHRITILCGHYGSGKTNIAVNMALDIRRQFDRVTLADLDIVNPYFRSADSLPLLAKSGIRLIVSDFANTNVDAPALPPDMYTLCDDRKSHAVIDLGGDDRGALALGRLRDRILAENDFDVLFVLNCYRPLTRTVQDALDVLQEVRIAGGLPITGLVNNSNLGKETTAETVLHSIPFAEEVSRLSGIPLLATCVNASLLPSLQKTNTPLFPLDIQETVLGDTII